MQRPVRESVGKTCGSTKVITQVLLSGQVQTATQANFHFASFLSAGHATDIFRLPPPTASASATDG